MNGTRTRRSVGAATVRARGEAILGCLEIEPSPDPHTLALSIVPAEAVPFRGELRSGLEALLEATARRRADLAAAAATRLVGLGPGRTPLGDDYLAGCGLAVARFGGPARFPSPERERWLSALQPRGLVGATTMISAYLITRALHGVAEPQVAALLRLRGDDSALSAAVARLSRIGATSGRAWAATIGATAILLAAERDDDDPDGGEPHA